MTIFIANVITAAFRNPSILYSIPLILLLLSPPPASTIQGLNNHSSGHTTTTTIFSFYLPLASAYTPSSIRVSPPSSTPWRYHHPEHHRRSISTARIKRSTSSLTKIAFTTTRSRLGTITTTTTTVLESTTRRLELWLDTTTDTSTRTVEEDDDNFDASSNDDDRLSLYQVRAAASTAVIIGAAHNNSNNNNPIEIEPIVGGGGTPPTILQRGEDNRLRRYSTTTSGNSDSEIVGVVVDPSTSTGIDNGMAAMGSTEWVVALPPLTASSSSSTSSSWNMIPAENLVGAARGTGTKIAFSLQRAGDAAGLEGALQLGIDALCIPLTATQEIWDAAVRATLARNDQISNEAAAGDTGAEPMTTTEPTIPRIVAGICWRAGSPSSSSAAVRADRVCIDLVQTLSVTEGCWIGSSVKIMALILSEAAVSALVPSRPFRINAGPVHSYVLMGDGSSTRYLSELTAGDEVLVYDARTGQSRSVAVGRLKVEVRPCVMVGLRVVGNGGCGGEKEEEEGGESNNHLESDVDDDVVGQIFLQQAETVRLGQSEGSYVRVTSLSTLDTTAQETDSRKAIQGDDVLLRIVGTGTHIGRAYSGKVLER